MYRLNLTDSDVDTIAFVGTRYGWSSALLSLNAGENILQEHEAWAIVEAMDEDTQGGHSYFPMLDGRSDLATKLFDFWGSIV